MLPVKTFRRSLIADLCNNPATLSMGGGFLILCQEL
jgi:hypothetical protein